MKIRGARSTTGVASEFERRAARAEKLTAGAPSSEEPLRFAAGLYRAQARLAELVEAAHSDEPLTGRLEEDVDRFLDRAPAIFRYAAESGPEALSDQARSRADDLPSTRRTRLLVYWQGDPGSREDYLSRAVLRPYVETLRALPVPPNRPHRQGRCPFCGGAAVGLGAPGGLPVGGCPAAPRVRALRGRVAREMRRAWERFVGEGWERIEPGLAGI